MVIYADILFVLNAYVTYVLLLVTDLLCRAQGSRLRRTLAALLGGVYAFIIFAHGLPRFLLILSRLAAAAVFIAIAYGKGSRKRFLLLYGGFFSVNFVFAGLMFALWSAFHPQTMHIFGSVVYFDINALLLVVMTVICYAFFYTAHLLLGARKPRRSLFRLTVTLDGKSISCNALSDTGNSVTEPFSGLPVILMERKTLLPLLADLELTDTEAAKRLHLRQIPCTGVSGASVLFGIRPDEITIRAADCVVHTNDVYLALCDAPLCGGDFGALLHPILTEEKNVILCES